ncbi:MAG: universal stress protein [Actinomycetota bacterium]
MAANRIVIGLDGSEGSARAVRWCVELARDLGSAIVAVHVFSVPVYEAVPAGFPVAPLDDETIRKELAETLEREWCAPIRDASIPFRSAVEGGHPATVLMEVAEREDARMIVVGSRGMGGFKELLLGSVSHQLAHHARRPLVIVPPPT